jgi:hypothetical protein
MLKAAAGGGGKGMRQVTGEHELQSALAAAQSEARRPLEIRKSIWRRWLKNRDTLKFKSSLTSTEMLFIWASVNARSSGAIRK